MSRVDLNLSQLADLLEQNRSYRNFDASHKITHQDLVELVGLTKYCASTVNNQVLRYRLVSDEIEVSKLHETVKYAALLKDVHLPYEGNDATAYIIICAKAENDSPAPHALNIGIAAQSILLGATAKGLGGCMIGNCDKQKITEILQIDAKHKLMLVLALGKPKEKSVIKTINLGESTAYYRDENDVHVVPKIKTEDIII